MIRPDRTVERHIKGFFHHQFAEGLYPFPVKGKLVIIKIYMPYAELSFEIR